MTPTSDTPLGRLSTEIGFKGTQSLYYSEQQAKRIGLPLNTLVVINFRHTDIPAPEAVAAFERWRSRHFTKWARRPQRGKGKGFAPTYAYAFENKRGDEVYDQIGHGLPHNVHVMVYMHIPADRLFDFRGKAVEWLDFIAGSLCAANAVKIERVEIDRGVAPYLRKGANRFAAPRYGVSHIQSPQGAIVGRRTGTSLNIGPKARRALDRDLGVIRKVPSRRV